MSNYEGMYMDAIRQLDAALARAEKAEADARGLGGKLAASRLMAVRANVAASAAEAREAALRAKVEVFLAAWDKQGKARDYSNPATKLNELGAIAVEVQGLRALLAPAGRTDAGTLARPDATQATAATRETRDRSVDGSAGEGKENGDG